MVLGNKCELERDRAVDVRAVQVWATKEKGICLTFIRGRSSFHKIGDSGKIFYKIKGGLCSTLIHCWCSCASNETLKKGHILSHVAYSYTCMHTYGLFLSIYTHYLRQEGYIFTPVCPFFHLSVHKIALKVMNNFLTKLSWMVDHLPRSN